MPYFTNSSTFSCGITSSVYCRTLRRVMIPFNISILGKIYGTKVDDFFENSKYVCQKKFFYKIKKNLSIFLDILWSVNLHITKYVKRKMKKNEKKITFLATF